MSEQEQSPPAPEPEKSAVPAEPQPEPVKIKPWSAEEFQALMQSGGPQTPEEMARTVCTVIALGQQAQQLRVTVEVAFRVFKAFIHQFGKFGKIKIPGRVMRLMADKVQCQMAMDEKTGEVLLSLVQPQGAIWTPDGNQGRNGVPRG